MAKATDNAIKLVPGRYTDTAVLYNTDTISIRNPENTNSLHISMYADSTQSSYHLKSADLNLSASTGANYKFYWIYCQNDWITIKLMVSSYTNTAISQNTYRNRYGKYW